MDVVLRKDTIAYAEPCGVISHKAFTTLANQHGFPSGLPDARNRQRIRAHGSRARRRLRRRRRIAGRIAGSNFLWESTRISGIVPITVDPDAQNAAVGRRVMDDVLGRAAENGSVGTRLVQVAYHSRSLSLYAKLGFDVRAARESAGCATA
jgi:GNAT superfamily N-acetyltransferase